MDCLGFIVDAWKHLDLVVRGNEEWAAWVQAIFTIAAMGFSVWQFKKAADSQRQDRRDAIVRAQIDSLKSDLKSLQPPFALVSTAAFAMKAMFSADASNPLIKNRQVWEKYLQDLERAFDAATKYPVYGLSRYREITAFNHFLTSLNSAVRVTKSISENVGMLSDDRFSLMNAQLGGQMQNIWAQKAIFQKQIDYLRADIESLEGTFR